MSFGGNGGGGGFGGSSGGRGGYQGGGGGGGNSGGGRGGGRGRSRGGSRGGRGGGSSRGGGRDGGGGGGGGRFNHDGDNVAAKARLRPCSAWTTSGNCTNPNCNFAHVAKLHGSIDASSVNPQQQNNNRNNYNNGNNNPGMEPVSSVAIWESPGQPLKMFTGSHDGFWRLWNPSGGAFVKEFEQKMGGKVEVLKVAYNYLFCGFEAISQGLPNVMVGMVHAWNLSQPAAPPLELNMHPMQGPGCIAYAHAQAVTDILIIASNPTSDDRHHPQQQQTPPATPQEPPLVVSGSRDGSIRIWKFDHAANNFLLQQSLLGHAREITGLVTVKLGNGNYLLWSSGTDAAIRIWDQSPGPGTGTCQYAITSQDNSQPPQPNQPNSPQTPKTLSGHTNAVTALVAFQSNNTTFILSSSLDGYVKAWNGTNAECVASEPNGEGVVSMSLGNLDNIHPPQTTPGVVTPDKQQTTNQLLILGLESGNIMVRNLIQTNNTPAFCLLFVLSSRYSIAHSLAVKTICSGPSGTFYSGGCDGKLLVWQFTNDLGL